MSQKQFSINIPCFNCQYGHSCRYYANALWVQWILQNNQCPAFTYHFDALYFGVLEQERKRKEEERNKPIQFDEFKYLKN